MTTIVDHDPAAPLDALVPHPENARVGDVGAISMSLEALGQYRPLVVNRRTNHVLAGNHTLQALQHLGHKTAAVTWVDVDEATERRILLADNRTAELATYDEKALLDLLLTVDDLAGTGYSPEDLEALDEMLSKPLSFDDKPEASADRGKLLDVADVAIGEPKHKVEVGDVWELSGGHRLVIADLFTGWDAYIPFLTDGVVFLPYPEPYATLSERAEKSPLLMVQPDAFLAGHLLDKHEAVHGAGSVTKR